MCWDSNPESSEHESPPITTRPGIQFGRLGKAQLSSNISVILC